MAQIAEQVASMFEAQGFNVSRSKTVDGLLQLANSPLVLCADGRNIAGTVFPYQELGPKVLGGALGQANFIAAAELGLIKRTTIKHLDKAINMNSRNGNMSGFHDIDDEHVHCAEQDGMQNGKIHKLPRQIYTPQQGRDRILSMGGEGVHLVGNHMESRVIANMTEGTTRAPDGTAFWQDIWYMLVIMKIPVHIVVAASAEILKGASPVRELAVVG